MWKWIARWPVKWVKRIIARDASKPFPSITIARRFAWTFSRRIAMEKTFNPKRLASLIEAICEAYSQALPGGRWAPIFAGDRIFTFCNETVNLVCKRMGYYDFDIPETPRPDDAKLANQMFNELIATDDWEETDVTEAQACANYGYPVVAAWKNPNPGFPGHVAIVMPGNLEYSGSWGDMAPKIMNVGKDIFICKKASWAFRKEAKPRYFVLKKVI